MKAKFESKYEKNFRFRVRKVPNPGRDFLENFWQFLRILDHFLVFSYGKTKHADFLIKKNECNISI